jgi:Ca2+-binding EF-hand superfamily protein
MIEGISGSGMQYMLQAQQMQHRQGPPPDMFKALDSNNSGGIDQSELDVWAKDMSSKTGQTIDTSKAISSYDADGDGMLSSTELDSFFQSSGIKGPDGPPPPPSSSQGSERGSEASKSGKSADSIISSYDADGDGVLSSSELQSYLDATQQNSTSNDLSSLLEQALSAYTVQSMKSGSSLCINNLNVRFDLSA